MSSDICQFQLWMHLMCLATSVSRHPCTVREEGFPKGHLQVVILTWTSIDRRTEHAGARTYAPTHAHTPQMLRLVKHYRAKFFILRQ